MQNCTINIKSTQERSTYRTRERTLVDASMDIANNNQSSLISMSWDQVRVESRNANVLIAMVVLKGIGAGL